MATEVVVTVRSSGGDYTSLSAAEAGEQRDLVSADEIAAIECYNDWTGNGLNESAGVTIAGWTTDSTRYVVVRAAAGEGHGGIPGAGFRMWRFENTVLRVEQSYTLVDGIECRNTDDGNGLNYAVYMVGTGLVVRNTIGSASYRVFVLDSNSFSDPCTVIQCLALPAGPNRTPTGFFGIDAGSSYGRAINCVVGDGCSVGFNASFLSGFRKFEAINCVVYSASTTSYDGTFDAASSNNAATDGSSNTPPGSSPYTSDVVSGDFVDAAGNDFHLASSSGLIGQGANQYSDTTTDIDGDSWPSSGAWDIGFDHYVSAGGPPTLAALTASNITTTGARLTVTV